MLRKHDEEFLSNHYPGLVTTGSGLAGTIRFEASYSEKDGAFRIFGGAASEETGGVFLAGEFNIRIEERATKHISALPAVYVEDIEPTSDRHFGADKSACLCSPLDEDEFLVPEFQIRLFLERLVVPFLYGQLYYSKSQRWPWFELAHGATGLIESYGRRPVPSKIEGLLKTLALCGNVWPAIRTALLQKGYIKGHTRCFCGKQNHIRRCHPYALEGINCLRLDVKDMNLPVP